ncbi:hypothetical protein ACWDWV_35430 [Streptosporangium sandarakinum]
MPHGVDAFPAQTLEGAGAAHAHQHLLQGRFERQAGPVDQIGQAGVEVEDRVAELVGDEDVEAVRVAAVADAGDSRAMGKLAQMRAEAGNQQEAERLVRFGLTAEGEIEAPWSP